ncbi:FG-GAP repeat protein [Yeosuana sp.]|uniref:FG-GAP repeat protein n=1 Tax=Yeosuana sp. TaxID=2529388 RepID=UPI00404AAC13
MKNTLLSLTLFLVGMIASAQVGINTTDPQGALDIESNDDNTLGMIVPRVPDHNLVTSVSGGSPVNGTIVYNTTTNALMFYIDGSWLSLALNNTGDGAEIGYVPPPPPTFVFSEISAYIKASNTGVDDNFGKSVSISADGNTLAIGVSNEDSSSVGINGNQTDNSAANSGAVYIFIRSGATWVQQAYIKSGSNSAGDLFGDSVGLSSDGNTLAVGAPDEDGGTTGINGDQTSNTVSNAGAAYIFSRSGTTWTQQAYIKRGAIDIFDKFGTNVAISSNGNTLAVSSPLEDSNATGIEGDQNNNGSLSSGAVYVFTRSGTIWSQQAYIKSSNSGTVDSFGSSIALNSDGNTIVASATGEDSFGSNSGMVYVFTRSGSTWTEQQRFSASNAEANDAFGISVSISSDGNTIAVGANGEDSDATGINGAENNNSSNASGAVYVFIKTGTTWSQQAYIKASNANLNDAFGWAVSLNSNGNTLVVGTPFEDSNGQGFTADPNNGAAPNSGAVYVYKREGTTWTEEDYVKSSNSFNEDRFGGAVSVSATGTVMAIGAILEDSNATGVGGDETNNSSSASGAVYVIE